MGKYRERKKADGVRSEVTLTSVEELNEYLRENGDGKTVISIVLELTGTDIEEDGAASGEGGVGNG